MTKRMQDKVALVTGASTGIGRAAARLLAKEGAKVVAAARREKEGNETVQGIKDSGGEAIFLRTDVAKKADVQDMVHKTLDAFGRLDCAVNNAAVGVLTPLLEMTEKEWDFVLDINLKGAFFCLQSEIAAMRANDGGSIVNVGSVNSFLGAPSAAAYVTSKHGLLGLTRVAAAEFAADNIRVNIVCPGLVDTETQAKVREILGGDNPYFHRTPQRRMANPEEIAYTILWLCSEEASFVTGASLITDGGAMAW